MPGRSTSYSLTCRSDVRFRGQIGKYLLTSSLSVYDRTGHTLIELTDDRLHHSDTADFASRIRYPVGARSRFVGDRMRFDQPNRLRIDCNRQHTREGRSHGHFRFSVRLVLAGATYSNRTRRHAAPAGVGLSRGVPGAIRLTARRAARRSQRLGGSGRDGFAYWRHAVSKAPPRGSAVAELRSARRLCRHV